VIRFRGREMEYKEQRGKEITDLIFKNVSLNGALEGEPFKEDKLIIFTIMPNKKPQ
jgi:translation initiation factor IF-3